MVVDSSVTIVACGVRGCLASLSLKNMFSSLVITQRRLILSMLYSLRIPLSACAIYEGSLDCRHKHIVLPFHDSIKAVSQPANLCLVQNLGLDLHSNMARFHCVAITHSAQQSRRPALFNIRDHRILVDRHVMLDSFVFPNRSPSPAGSIRHHHRARDELTTLPPPKISRALIPCSASPWRRREVPDSQQILGPLPWPAASRNIITRRSMYSCTRSLGRSVVHLPCSPPSFSPAMHILIMAPTYQLNRSKLLNGRSLDIPVLPYFYLVGMSCPRQCPFHQDKCTDSEQAGSSALTSGALPSRGGLRRTLRQRPGSGDGMLQCRYDHTPAAGTACL